MILSSNSKKISNKSHGAYLTDLREKIKLGKIQGVYFFFSETYCSFLSYGYLLYKCTIFYYNLLKKFKSHAFAFSHHLKPLITFLQDYITENLMVIEAL